jgi:hypothetical protein
MRITIQLNIYTVTYVEYNKPVGYSNTLAEAKDSLPFQMVVVFFVCY